MLTNTVVNRVVTQTKADATYTELRRLILDGDLAGNTVLNQEQLAASLGVSTTPLREALRRLESEALVETRSKGQVVVTEVDSSLLPHILVVLEELDCLAIKLAAQNATPQDLVDLHAALAIRPEAGDHMEDWTANTDFHHTIHQATHNPVLIDELGRLRDQYDRHYARFTDVVFFDTVAQHEHAAMVEAIEQKHAKEGVALMRKHYQRGFETISHEPA